MLPSLRSRLHISLFYSPPDNQLTKLGERGDDGGSRTRPHPRRTRATAETPWRPCWGAVPCPGGSSHVRQPREGLAPPQTFIQRLARHAQQASGHALIAVGVPQGGGNQGIFGLFQSRKGLCIPRTLGKQSRGGQRLPGQEGSPGPHGVLEGLERETP